MPPGIGEIERPMAIYQRMHKNGDECSPCILKQTYIETLNFHAGITKKCSIQMQNKSELGVVIKKKLPNIYIIQTLIPTHSLSK